MRDDSKIIDAIRKGLNSDYLNILYKRSLPKVKNYIRKKGGRLEDVEDVFQDAVVIFVQKVRDKSFNESYDIDGFIFTICRNLFINKLKVQNRTTLSDEIPESIDSEPTSLNYMISEEKTNKVNELLAQLGEACYDLMQLTIIKELPLKEVAKLLGYSSEGIAKTYNYRCKKKLMKLVEEQPQVLAYFQR